MVSKSEQVTHAYMTDVTLLEQTQFWLKIMDGWKREIGRVMQRSELVNASPAVTAEVARTAGELSMFAEQLNDLYTEIDYHKLQLPGSETQEKSWRKEHEYLYRKLGRRGEQFRGLLTAMFRLDKEAYRRFLC